MTLAVWMHAFATHVHCLLLSYSLKLDSILFFRLRLCRLSALKGLTAFACNLLSRPEELAALTQLQSLRMWEVREGSESEDQEDDEPAEQILSTSETDLQHLSGTHKCICPFLPWCSEYPFIFRQANFQLQNIKRLSVPAQNPALGAQIPSDCGLVAAAKQN